MWSSDLHTPRPRSLLAAARLPCQQPTPASCAYAKKGWRKPKNEIAHLRKDVHYGQYLQVPKGQRDIFVRKERRSNAGSLIAAIIVLAIIAAVFYFLWTWMSANWGVAIR